MNPTTPRAVKNNEIINKKIASINAVAYMKTEGASARAAAKKYKIAHSSLQKMLKTGKVIGRQGKKSKLSEYEERIIKNRALEIVQRGEYLSTEILKKIITEEVNVLLINFPERENILIHLLNSKHFAYNFATRHNLHRFYPEDEKERKFECDVCFKRFTYNNALVLHKKRIHYSFLQ